MLIQDFSALFFEPMSLNSVDAHEELQCFSSGTNGSRGKNQINCFGVLIFIMFHKGNRSVFTVLLTPSVKHVPSIFYEITH